MKVVRKPANNDSNRSVNETSQRSWQNQLAQVVNNSKEAVAQRSFIAGINDSPRMVAQRRQIEDYRGSEQMKQLQTPPSNLVSNIRAKLIIGEPVNKFEQEADRVAAQVVEQINTPASAESTQMQSVQREAIPEEGLQTKFLLQRREAIEGGEASTDLESAINNAKSSGQALDTALQRSMGLAMGADFSGVRVHTDVQSDQLNQSIQARAFTTGLDVYFRQGAYEPGSRRGQELIAHELTHVVQQNGGSVQRTGSVQGAMQTNGLIPAQPVVQRRLIPLNAQDRPGRLPDDEKSLQGLLEANGFDAKDREKLRSKRANWQDLRVRMTRVLEVENKFNGANVNPAKRRTLRSRLEFEYDSLVDQADRYRNETDVEYDQALTAEAGKIRGVNPTVNELFKGGAPWKTAKPLIVVPLRIAKFTDAESYAEAVRARYKKLYKSPAVAAPTLSLADQATLTAEQAAVTAQLNQWNTMNYNDEGCNDNGTWGTSSGGVGANWNVSHVNQKVWSELKTWWQAKQNTYVALSDTSTYSLKKRRSAPFDPNRSPTFNYHINVP